VPASGHPTFRALRDLSDALGADLAGRSVRWDTFAVDVPEIEYTRSGDVAIAYQTFGDGPRDLVLVPMFSNLVFPWLNSDWRRMYERFASFSRLIMFDKRGTGLSDRPRELGPIETRMDDIRAVLDAVGADRATLVGMVEGGQTCALFAATYPERTEALVLANTPARAVSAEDYPYGIHEDEWRAQLRAVRERWGERDYLEAQAREINPTADEDFIEWFVTCQRFCASPGAALTFYRVYGETDLREMLPTIRVPTLVLYRRQLRDQMLDLAGRIKGAHALEIKGGFTGFEDLTREVEAFLSGMGSEPVPDTVLATVMFTDIVGSTERAATLGDRAWRDLLRDHHILVRRELARFRGKELDTAGDGFFAVFDGPARAISCARTIVGAVSELDLTVRAGVHTGECELQDGKVTGIAVNIGARVAAAAGPGEVLVSGTVKDLVAGSGIEFQDKGVRQLKGVPGEWRLYVASPA
jgi:class 3 adenylate cyclase/pimeloyl-ACP methyl ester carboxylesterase